MAVKTKYKDERQKTKVLLFVEGDTDVLFFRSLMEYYRAHSETPVQPYTICNMKGVTRYSSRLKAKLQNEYLPAASAEGVKITAVCCSYDTDVFVRNPQLVDWKAIGKMVDRVGAQFTQVGVEQMLRDLEAQIIACARDALSASQLDEIKDRVKDAYPMGVQNPKPVVVVIDDIVQGYKVPKGTRIFLKPIGVSEEPIYAGDFSKDKYMHFSKRQPRVVHANDILIAYAVGARRIIGAFKVTSDPIKIDDSNARWPWYVTSECLTPHLSNHTWEQLCPVVTQIANSYVNDFDQPITRTRGRTLGALNYGSDKIQLDNKYGLYLLSELMELERTC